jgi:hypothetical protein
VLRAAATGFDYTGDFNNRSSKEIVWTELKTKKVTIKRENNQR